VVAVATSKAVAGFSVWAATYEETVANEVFKYAGMPYEQVLSYVADTAQIEPRSQVLDIGTGTGALALAIAGQLVSGRIVGIDPTAAMLERARANATRLGLVDKVHFDQAPAEALPYPDGTFDVVVSSLAMHHTHVPTTLGEIVRVLKPGGRLAIADMSRNVRLDSLLGFLVKPLLGLFYLASKRSIAMTRAEMEAYGQMYTASDWERLLAEAGLLQVQVREYPHPNSQWYSSVLIIQAGK
jgi:ubiquinone/menaquinone biosynthesis C-methylase UbiE